MGYTENINNETEVKKTTDANNSSSWDKLKTAGSNFVSGIKSIIERLFGKTSANGKTQTPVQPTTLVQNTSNTPTATTLEQKAGNTPQATTYSENISPTVETKTVTGAQQTPTKTTPAVTEIATETSTAETGGAMTYEEYIAQMKDGYAKDLEAAKKDAEIVKERAMANAQSSYSQNVATYGANAETVAQMGLTGGGYSDYLNAQAYAQKRADVQTANAQEVASKSQAQATYQEYINQANQRLAEKALYEEQLAEQRAYNEKQLQEQRAYEEQQLADQRAYAEQQEAEQRAYEEQQAEKTKRENLFATLWEGVQDIDSGYTAEAIDALGKEYGLSDAQLTTLKNLLAATQSKSEKETSSAIKDAAIADIQANGGNVSGDYVDGLKDIGLSEEDAETVQNAINNSITNTAMQEIDAAIQSGDVNAMETSLASADKYYKNGQISTEKYQELYGTYQTYSVKTVMGIDYGSDYNKKLGAIIDQKTELTEQYNAGKLSKDTYDSLMAEINKQNKNTASGGWYIQGLGSGRNNDDVDITIGKTSRDKGTEYDLLCGDAIKDSKLVEELNRIATGDPKKTPSTSGEGSGWFFGVGSDPSISSSDKPNKLIVAYGNMYLYTTKGWVPLKDDNNGYDLKNAIRAYLGGGVTNSENTTSTPITYPSDTEIANKASSGTLTYHDVAKYNPGIRTQSEFARGNNADKQKYGTYQAYLQAMYEKYKK